LTAIVATPTLRDVYYHRVHRGSNWLFSSPVTLPTWAVWAGLAANVFFYSYLVWVCFWVFRAAGKERILVVGWFFVIFSTPIEHFVSRAVAFAIQEGQAVGMAAAILVALDHLRPISNQQRSGLTFALRASAVDKIHSCRKTPFIQL
jgi:hypothetical protein